MSNRLLWPLVTLAFLLIANVVHNHDFFSITMKEGHLFGSLIDILNRAAPLVLISIGMTFVIATKGIDLSVGSIVSIAGAMACLLISKQGTSDISTLFMALGIALLLSLAAGAWNGLLVSFLGIQPIVATLILMVAGRGVAQLITNGQIITVSSKPYSFIGGGYLFGLPFSIFIITFFFLIAVILTRKTAIGLFIESVGSNPTASRLAGIRSSSIIFIVYVLCAFLSGLAGIILSSNVSSADGNNAGLWYELDAILAVVIGGNSLNGGRFYLSGTIIGALIIQTLTTSIYSIGVPPEITLVVKAIVVLIVCLIQSDAFRASLAAKRKAKQKNVEQGVTV
ncbi:ABC transporter permease [Paenibacillus vulneris]|uniref:ABC transporter permease n=1 Tax=Paenibacillus vulneris TaxID=1133364 RepID=A0ABW3UD71_9BACL|nr:MULTISPECIES: ABC transporter permease [unclassified Paenibacillus]MBE1440884.1 simple sugar transport system permease protein [Paenibacillus sp. OAS669]